MRFTATIQFLLDQRAAIVALFDSKGEWSGAGRVECRSGRREDLIEIGYKDACARAACKGGMLDSFREHIDPEKCPSRMEPRLERRPGNALNIEIGTPMVRCSRMSPDGRGLAWLLSGGSMLAYGHCTSNSCPSLIA
jgi:hypothetical protein